MNKIKKYIYCFIILFVGVCILSIIAYQNIPPESKSVKKVVHVSFDDVFIVLKELKVNESHYESIFESTFFRDLRNLHNAYGAKFSLYVFEKDKDFNIKDMPIKYYNEFVENSSWLKFGFHAVEPELIQITFEGLKNSYWNVQDAICRFAGQESLCPTLRLHYFMGNDSTVSFINESGVTGLLGADDDRISYDLNPEEDKILQNNFFLQKKMKYFKTDLRFEKKILIDYKLLTLRNRDTLVVFMHEWAYNRLSLKQWAGRVVYDHNLSLNVDNRWRFRRGIKWLWEHNYEFCFLK